MEMSISIWVISPYYQSWERVKPPEYHMDNDTMLQQASQRDVFEKIRIFLFSGGESGDLDKIW
jgi:hypothetical protein